MPHRCCLLLVLVALHFSQAFIPHCDWKISRTEIFMASSSQKPKTSVSSAKKNPRLYPFEEARKIARGHGFESKQEFLDYDCAGAYQLPKKADEVWRDDWTSWEDFLGFPLDFEQGRQVAHALQLKDKQEYLSLMESKTISDNELASRLPYRPDLKYKDEWISWDDWLGTTD